MVVIRDFQGWVLCGVLGLSGCAELEQRISLELGGGAPSSQAAAAGPVQGVPATGVNTPEALDRSTPAERLAATVPRAAGARLGQTVASLGSPSEPGFWLKTPLVAEQVQGRARNPATGKSVAVTLIPIEGQPTAGSRISLSAMRALEVRLSDLVTLDVTRN